MANKTPTDVSDAIKKLSASEQGEQRCFSTETKFYRYLLIYFCAQDYVMDIFARLVYIVCYYNVFIYYI